MRGASFILGVFTFHLSANNPYFRCCMAWLDTQVLPFGLGRYQSDLPPSGEGSCRRFFTLSSRPGPDGKDPTFCYARLARDSDVATGIAFGALVVLYYAGASVGWQTSGAVMSSAVISRAVELVMPEIASVLSVFMADSSLLRYTVPALLRVGTHTIPEVPSTHRFSCWIST